MCSDFGVTKASGRTSETKLEFPYSRTLGPVMGAFMAGLREGRLFGIRGADGRVIVPPVEYDPETGEALGTEMVEVGPGGRVESWAWVDQPSPKHPLQKAFAFALVRPDGADTSILSPIDAGDLATMASGLRVKARFAKEPKGLVTDLEAWEPERS